MLVFKRLYLTEEQQKCTTMFVWEGDWMTECKIGRVRQNIVKSSAYYNPQVYCIGRCSLCAFRREGEAHCILLCSKLVYLCANDLYYTNSPNFMLMIQNTFSKEYRIIMTIIICCDSNINSTFPSKSNQNMQFETDSIIQPF